MNKTQLQTAVKLEIQISKARSQLAALEGQLADLRLEALRQVEVVKNDSSITLLFNGRRINAKKNIHNRYVVKEGKTLLKSEYFSGIHDLRFEIARGTI